LVDNRGLELECFLMSKSFLLTCILLVFLFSTACRKTTNPTQLIPTGPSENVDEPSKVISGKSDENKNFMKETEEEAYPYPLSELSNYPMEYPYPDLNEYPMEYPYPELLNYPSPYPENVTAEATLDLQITDQSYPTLSSYPDQNNPNQSEEYPNPLAEVNPITTAEEPTLTPNSITPVPTIPPIPIVTDRRLIASNPSLVKINSGKVQLIMFFAFWDGTSKAMVPIIHQLEDEMSAEVNFLYLDIDDPANNYYKELLGFRNQPHFILLDEEGNQIKDWYGFVDDEEIRNEIQKVVVD
jgi:thiol-disulfide isomerase/thioredoxin